MIMTVPQTLDGTEHTRARTHRHPPLHTALTALENVQFQRDTARTVPLSTRGGGDRSRFTV